jgi:hypothetical protein
MIVRVYRHLLLTQISRYLLLTLVARHETHHDLYYHIGNFLDFGTTENSGNVRMQQT